MGDALDLHQASEAQLRALHDLYLETEAEELPEEPPIPFEERLVRWRHRPDFEKSLYWVHWEGDRAVGSAVLILEYLDTNRHQAGFWIQVRRDRRRRRLGTRLLGPALAAAETGDRTLLHSWTWEGSPAEGFLTAIGARKKLRERISRLWVKEVDLDLMRSWIDRAPERAFDYELVFWEGPCPDDLLAAYVEMTAVMNTAPREDFEAEDWVLTAPQTRTWEASKQAQGIEWWTLSARHKPSGRLAGYTQVLFNPYRPFLAHQGDTGVDPDHRNRGLGRWLKATMFLRLIERRPEVDRIDTGNAGSNEPMLAINDEMGFRPLLFEGAWQVPLVKAREALDRLEPRTASRR